MSGFQTQVQSYPSIGVPGERASGNPVVHRVPTPLADGDVSVASFVFGLDSAPTLVAKASSAGAYVVGFVERLQAQVMYDATAEASQVIPSGCPATVAVKGDFYCKSLTTATVGQKVFASTSDGTIKTGAANATVSGYVETDFSVIVGAAIGEIVTISNWS